MNDLRTQRIFITGLVQGIGFRPFIYNLATRLGVNGNVRNGADAVEILAGAPDATIDEFIRTIKTSPPPLARIDSIRQERAAEVPGEGFYILESADSANGVTDVSPDIAVCEHCLADLKKQPHRIGYPLVNCTLCGPRFSIIQSVPYDRSRTTMAPFAMCDKCEHEYTDPTDRRFHAQPVACNECGPCYTLYTQDATVEGNREVVVETARLIESGAVVAIKGTGGFHLACSPFAINALRRLRSGKRRDGKPFACMFRDLPAVREYAEVSREEEVLLTSTVSPIVLLACAGKTQFAPEVNNHLSTIGAMLPYMPFHYLLFEQTALSAIVMTSGNISEEPIVIDNEIARETFSGIADATVVYNRDIHNRLDDSVCAVFETGIQILRRSRGFAPTPVVLGRSVEGVVATGAELKNCFALGKGRKAILSQHIGDLKNSATLEFYREAFERFCMLYRVSPALVAHDLHPDYLSTGFAQELGVPAVAVQHHHAHIAACCAENSLEGKVIGVAFDGTGYGSDGAVWGGEFLFADCRDFDRMAHLCYVGMPGGDRAAVEPWRMAASWLHATFGGDFMRIGEMVLPSVAGEHLAMIRTALDKGINTPQTSSAGRLFDAVAALCGLCDTMSFEAEAAMRLESICGDPLTVQPLEWEGREVIDLRQCMRQIVELRKQNTPVDIIATRFHATIIDCIVKTCDVLRSSTGCNEVALSGGCFQNRIIYTATIQELQENRFKVYTHRQVPCNDGGIALGQLVVAANRRDSF